MNARLAFDRAKRAVKAGTPATFEDKELFAVLAALSTVVSCTPGNTMESVEREIREL